MAGRTSLLCLALCFAPAILFQGNNIPNSVCIQIPDVGAVIDRAYIRRKSS